MAKKVSEMTPKEYREKLIKDRANRLAKEAAKQGITPAELKKKKGQKKRSQKVTLSSILFLLPTFSPLFWLSSMPNNCNLKLSQRKKKDMKTETSHKVAKQTVDIGKML